MKREARKKQKNQKETEVHVEDGQEAEEEVKKTYLGNDNAKII